MSYRDIERRALDAGLVLRGGFHPVEADRVPALPDGSPSAVLLLLGFAGSGSWAGFAASAEAQDGRADPLDRWSRRVVGDLAAGFGAMPLYPFGGPPFLPFHAWARRAEPVFTSPLGILIHPEWGLWHSWRGALAFADAIALPDRTQAVSPCDSCAAKPCLGACPVGAFTPGRYAVSSCVAYLRKAEGADCMNQGCAARRACPVGEAHRYGPVQARFHMRSFLAGNSAN